MSNTAISAQGSTLQVATGSGSPITITAAADGSPTILTAAAHGLALGDVGTISGSTAPAGLNGTFPVIAKTVNTFAIPLDTTGGAAMAGSPIFTPAQWTGIKNLKTFKGMDGKVAKLDATNLSSTAKEYISGLLDPGQFSFDVDLDANDAGQTALRNFLATAAVVSFKLTLPNAHTATFLAFVETFPWDGGVDKIVTASVNLIISGPVTYA
ncbi:phage tail protein [Paraburkholderia panacisoli]|uniref:Phage tail protein n=1 Tax=Paraburkholderia panacisoli TaxID=2603818 RepID=A0A5B0HM14_9BURK|nr:phage tail tube protein [Paraburkholderia panacisoli]KAA1015974.1 phage tail protein [Paraburkholderia panacisoli]